MRFLLFPLSMLYGFFVFIRNRLFDTGWLKQVKFDVPVVVVGNLNAGGSGKSPMVRFLAEKLRGQYKIAILSRGYGRRSRGFLPVSSNGSPIDFGDEPMQYAQDLPGVRVFVCEDRVAGISRILKDHPETNLVLLDDAYQHRYVSPGVALLLTPYKTPFYRDFLLPVGYLREPASAARRADLLVVTKCPVSMQPDEMSGMEAELHPGKGQKVVFSYIRYREQLTGLYEGDLLLKTIAGKDVMLVCGLANPEPLIEFLKEIAGKVHTSLFKDHHPYSVADAIAIKKKFTALSAQGVLCILTTRKDAVRLQHPEIKMHLKGIAFWVVDIEMGFHGAGESELLNYVTSYAGKSGIGR